MEFKPVADVSTLLPILEGRLPGAANVYNAAKLSTKWPSEFKWYILTVGEISATEIILAVVSREDWYQEVLVSRHDQTLITNEIRKSFSNTKAIDWKRPFFFAAVDDSIVELVVSISWQIYRNEVGIYPCYTYYWPESAVKPEKTQLDEGVSIGPINGDEGIEFLSKTWKYWRPAARDYARKFLERNPSTGIRINGEIVSSAVVVTHGLIGMLYTRKDHRRKNFGQMTMHHIMGACLEQGLVPACTVEVQNMASAGLMERLGFKRLPAFSNYVGHFESAPQK